MAKITFDTKGVGMFKSLNITKAPKTESNSTNPFGLSFKGNVIQADVFETGANKEHNSTPIRERGKMFMSAVVGNINSFNNAIKARLNSVVSFGRQVRDNVSNWWEQAKNTEVSLDFSGISKMIGSKFNNGEYSVHNLTKRPVGELESMLRHELETEAK